MLFVTELDILLAKKLTSHMFFSHNYAIIKIDFYDSMPLKKTLRVCVMLLSLLIQLLIKIKAIIITTYF